jgi:hypothetical protein
LAKPEDQKENRASLFGEVLPELPSTERLADLWQQLGCAQDSINGAIPLDWRELQAFADLSQCDITPCEAACLIDMSRAYCVEIGNRNPLRKSPMERET